MHKVTQAKLKKVISGHVFANRISNLAVYHLNNKNHCVSLCRANGNMTNVTRIFTQAKERRYLRSVYIVY